MGCRETHANRLGASRATQYYQTQEGRMKKKALNAKRKRKADATPPSDPPSDSIEELDQSESDGDLAEYLRSTLSMLEGRSISREEIQRHMERWREELRQRSLDGGEKPRTLPDD
jgi:hypothetical protein